MPGQSEYIDTPQMYLNNKSSVKIPTLESNVAFPSGYHLVQNNCQDLWIEST